MFEVQAGGRGMGVEVGEGVAAIQAEPYDDETIVAQVCGNAGEHDTFGAWGEEGHDVAGEHRGVEQIPLALGGKIKFRQVGDEPGRAGMIGLGRLDQLPVGVDTDHNMPAGGQCGANPSRPAAGIQHARPPREHRIEQPGLPVKVHSLGGHPAEPLDVPLGMTGAVRRDPTRQLTHPTTVATRSRRRAVSRLDPADGPAVAD